MGSENITAAAEFRDPPEREGDVLERLRDRLSTSLELAPRVLEIVGTYEARVHYPPGEFATSLHTVAALMQSDFGTRVFSLRHQSYDSHSAGLRSQEDVLAEFCLGIDAFLRDIAGTQAERECLILCCSEMGRRLAENASRGTDHGAAAPVFLFGKQVAGGLHGQHPSLEELDHTGSLIHQVDFRSAYAAVIDQWFGGQHREVLQQEVEPLALIG